ncbi:Cobalamin B12-binding domain protein (fragment) [Desulfamplus magnetovallimortis]|uniref:Cobalamin B12-binding domain protein n=1 Tax=Desulfamplus magnetovallimortis TaxID=1246637 RepID=A0A1W1HIG8_9BACT
MSIFYPAPGSVDYGHCLEQNILPENLSLMRSSALPLSDITSRLQSVTLLRLARIVNFIKSVKGANATLPPPESYCEQRWVGDRCAAYEQGGGSYRRGADFSLTEREKLSLKLLQWFLHDGIIRGVEGNAKVFEHFTDVDLSRFFLGELNKCESNISGKYDETVK